MRQDSGTSGRIGLPHSCGKEYIPLKDVLAVGNDEEDVTNSSMVVTINEAKR